MAYKRSVTDALVKAPDRPSSASGSFRVEGGGVKLRGKYVPVCGVVVESLMLRLAVLLAVPPGGKVLG